MGFYEGVNLSMCYCGYHKWKWKISANVEVK